jgi:hypothetical protein
LEPPKPALVTQKREVVSKASEWTTAPAPVLPQVQVQVQALPLVQVRPQDEAPRVIPGMTLAE